MSFQTAIAYFSARHRDAPPVIRAFARERGLRLQPTATHDDLMATVNRSFPACVVLDDAQRSETLGLCRSLKSDTFTAIIPVLVIMERTDPEGLLGCMEAGADEVLSPEMEEREQRMRLSLTLERADRAVSVHPTTRLPGTVQIARDISERLAEDQPFAVCYADIDHFKEFNDRYGYHHGDRVILILSRILRDVVKGRAAKAFIGHIGGDDFIFNVPLEHLTECCEEIIEIFDELLPYQYSPEDRERGYFLGKDRRGNVHRVPLMTLSIGVVTNEHRVFSHTARVSELASEMKAYAKTLHGSRYAVDRRRDAAGESAPGGEARGDAADRPGTRERASRVVGGP